MKYIQRWFLFTLFLLTAGSAMGTVDYSQDQLRKDVDIRLADLHHAKAGLNLALADQDAAQAELTGVKARGHTTQEVRTLQARLDKDESDIQAYTIEILGDVNFLQTQWSLLTMEEKDFVTETSKSLT